MGDDSEWLKLPIAEKCEHKVWKARLAGFEEATKLFQQIDDEKSPEFTKYVGMVKKFVVDANEFAREKGLDATLAFVENAQVAGRACSEVMGGIVAKCLNGKTKMKEKAFEIIMMYIEIEKHELVMEELITGLSNKQPKIVQGCAEALRLALRDFGPKVVQIKPILKLVLKLLEDRDKGVRDEAKLLVVEMYRWIGAAIKPQLQSLKPILLQELDVEFEKTPSGRAQQTRFLRSQQDLKAKFEEAKSSGGNDGGAEVAGGVEGPAVTVDPYDLMDPVEILSKLPKDFYEKMEAKKWQDRKEALEACEALVTKNLRLEPGDYGDLVKVLKKTVSKDANVMLVVIAAKCITYLCNGLRKKYAPYTLATIESLLDRFREKKQNIIDALKEAIDACFISTNLEAMSEDLVAALGNKTPGIKIQAALFVGRCFGRSTATVLNKKILKIYIPPLIKVINEADPSIRDAGYEAIGVASKVVGEKIFAPYVADLDKMKMDKIKEFADKCILAGKSAKPAESAEPEARPATAPPSKVARGAVATPKVPVEEKSADTPSSAPPPKRPATAPASRAPAKKPVAKKGAKAEVKEVEEQELSEEQVETLIGDMMSAEVVTALSSANWKERLSSMETFIQACKAKTPEELPCQACARTILKKPGLKENNFQVLKLKLDLIVFLAQEGKCSKRCADFVLPDVIDKIGDPKNGQGAKDALSALAEACGLDHVGQQVVQQAFEGKNPKNQTESLNWLSQAITEFGLKVDVKPLITAIKAALGATNPAVRTSAVSLIGNLYLYMGDPIRVLFEGEKAALVALIDAEIEKNKGQKPPAPIKGLKKQAASEADDDDDGGGGGGRGAMTAAEEEKRLQDLLPRTDISDQITEALMEQLNDKSWKIRNEGLEKITTILSQAKFVTANLGELPAALKARLSDSNKILVGTALQICTTLAKAMGPNCKIHIHTVVPGIMSNMGDNKAQLRQTAVTALNAWVEQTTLTPLVEGEVLLEAVQASNPNFKTELLGWLAQVLPKAKKLPPELKQCVPFVFAALEDRNSDVRAKAAEALGPFMIHVTYPVMMQMTNKLKPASKPAVVALLDKVKAELPAPEPPKEVSKPPPKPREVKEHSPPVSDSKPAMKPPSSARESKPPAESRLADSPSPPSSEAKSSTSRKSVLPKGKVAAPAATSKAKKKEGDEDTAPVMVKSNKEKRVEDDKHVKVLKWNFETPRKEYIEQLKTQMETCFSRSIVVLLFHDDFKNHLTAIGLLIKAVDDLPEETISNLDVILKWLTLRFFDTNTTVLIKTLELVEKIFAFLKTEGYHLLDFEANCFIPYMILKIGDPKDVIRKSVKTVIKHMCSSYPATKIFAFLMAGLVSKNARQRAEILEELGNLISGFGLSVCNPTPTVALKEISKQIGDRDTTVRNAALNTVVVAYNIVGEGVFKYTGQLPDKDQSLLDERIKRTSKSRPSSFPPPAPMPAAGPPTPAMQETGKIKLPQSKMSMSQAAAPSAAENDRDPSPRKSVAHVAPQMRNPPAEFKLDSDDEPIVLRQLALVDLGDCSELLNFEYPHHLRRARTSPTAAGKVPPSLETSQQITLDISRAASSEDSRDIIDAYLKLEEVIKEEQTVGLMEPKHINHLLGTCCAKIRNCLGANMAQNKTDGIKVIQTSLDVIKEVFSSETVCKMPSRDTVKEVLQTLLQLMTDQQAAAIEEGKLTRATNVIMMSRVLEKGDFTTCFCACIKLLNELVTTSGSGKTVEYLMKVIWKLTRELPERKTKLSVGPLLFELDAFLRAHPSKSWSQKDRDTLPLRTVKTVVQNLCQEIGQPMTSHVKIINDYEQTELFRHVKKYLERIGVDKQPGETPTNRKLTKEMQDQLTNIFKKIGQKENVVDGLNELYDFQLSNPDIDYEQLLRKSSKEFREFLQKRLKGIESERKHKAQQHPQSASNSQMNEHPRDAADENDTRTPLENREAYMEKLREMRAKAGLPPLPDNASEESASSSSSDLNSGSSSLGSLAHLGASVSRQHEESAAVQPLSNMEEIRRRLEEIKRSQ